MIKCNKPDWDAAYINIQKCNETKNPLPAK